MWRFPYSGTLALCTEWKKLSLLHSKQRGNSSNYLLIKRVHGPANHVVGRGSANNAPFMDTGFLNQPQKCNIQGEGSALPCGLGMEFCQWIAFFLAMGPKNPEDQPCRRAKNPPRKDFPRANFSNARRWPRFDRRRRNRKRRPHPQERHRARKYPCMHS